MKTISINTANLAAMYRLEAHEMGVPLASYLKAAHKLLKLKRSDAQLEGIAAAMESCALTLTKA